MNNKSDKYVVVLSIIFPFVIVYFLLYQTGKWQQRYFDLKKDAVANGYAEFNKTNGNWQWIKK